MNALFQAARHSSLGACAHGLAALLLLLAAVAAAADTAMSPPAVEISYESGMLTVDARDATLGEVLDRVAELAGLRVFVPPQLAEKRGSWSLSRRPLPDALASIVQPHSMLLLHEAAAAPGGGLRVTEVHVLPSGASAASASSPAARPAVSAASNVPGALAGAKPEITAAGEMIRWLQTLARDPDPTNRRLAVSELESLRSDEAVRGLERALTDKDAEVRIEVVQALGRIGAETSLPALGRVAISDRDQNVREAAVQVLESDPRPQAQNYLAQQRRRQVPATPAPVPAQSTAGDKGMPPAAPAGMPASRGYPSTTAPAVRK